MLLCIIFICNQLVNCNYKLFMNNKNNIINITLNICNKISI